VSQAECEQVPGRVSSLLSGNSHSTVNGEKEPEARGPGRNPDTPIPSDAQQLLERATAILPASDEDLIYKGIAAGVSERILDLKKSRARLQRKHSSQEELERKVKREGVSPDDHTLYTDLLEWRAIDHELTELLHMLEAL